MNGARGEARVRLAGKERTLCLTLGALAEIETALGVKGLGGLAERMRALSARTCRRCWRRCCEAAVKPRWPAGWPMRRSIRVRPRRLW